MALLLSNRGRGEQGVEKAVLRLVACRLLLSNGSSHTVTLSGAVKPVGAEIFAMGHESLNGRQFEFQYPVMLVETSGLIFICQSALGYGGSSCQAFNNKNS